MVELIPNCYRNRCQIRATDAQLLSESMPESMPNCYRNRCQILAIDTQLLSESMLELMPNSYLELLTGWRDPINPRVPALRDGYGTGTGRHSRAKWRDGLPSFPRGFCNPHGNFRPARVTIPAGNLGIYLTGLTKSLTIATS